MNLPTFLHDDPRVTIRNRGGVDPEGRAVVYWMQRAQRIHDNPAFEAAARAANALDKPLVVFFGLVPDFPNANERHYRFMLDGLVETTGAAERIGARFVLGVRPDHDLARFCAELRPALVVGDENPLRVPERWRREYARRIGSAFVTIDADTVVPSALFPKEEFAARTLRPKIHRVLDRYLAPGKRVPLKHRDPDLSSRAPAPPDPAGLLSELGIDGTLPALPGETGGRRAGLRRLKRFVSDGLPRYHERRNRPEIPDGTSRLSAFLHFGQIGPREVTLAVRGADAPEAAKEAFLEELIVRRELCINYVLRNEAYERYEGLHPWARGISRFKSL